MICARVRNPTRIRSRRTANTATIKARKQTSSCIQVGICNTLTQGHPSIARNISGAHGTWKSDVSQGSGYFGACTAAGPSPIPRAVGVDLHTRKRLRRPHVGFGFGEVDGSDGTDRRWRIGRNVAADRAHPSASWPVLIDPRRTAPVRSDAADPHTGQRFAQHASTQRPHECASADDSAGQPLAHGARGGAEHVTAQVVQAL